MPGLAKVKQAEARTILCLDIGNTNLTWMFGSDEERMQKGKSSDLDALADLASAPNEVRLACVRAKPQDTAYWVNAVRTKWALNPKVAKVLPNCGGLIPAYDDLSTLGVDRWLGLLRLHLYSADRPWLLVDVGTAISIDLLVGGHHLGGLLAPGLESMRHAFFTHTGIKDSRARPWSECETTDDLYGRDTHSCLAAGTDLMSEDFVWRRVDVFYQQNPSGEVVFTGGDGEKLWRRLITDLPPDLVNLCRYDSHLVCRGLLHAFG